jgi:predicted DNA binding CopG/RHH family protein
MGGKEKKAKEISGWYAQQELTPEEKEAQRLAIERWYEKKHRLNYRSVPLEIPGKMMLALGKIAMEQGISFSEFIEEILEGYLRQKKVHWKKG